MGIAKGYDMIIQPIDGESVTVMVISTLGVIPSSSVRVEMRSIIRIEKRHQD